ncbi:hypothetical protein HMPREF1153_1785 [Selenomonas sp. CM52]|nr:hypothetical protein HMPREF1153_1785 [Selenomonas sp. CM52]
MGSPDTIYIFALCLVFVVYSRMDTDTCCYFYLAYMFIYHFGFWYVLFEYFVYSKYRHFIYLSYLER